MTDPHNLQRFIDAQEPVYRQVVAELAAGEKRSHWMWFVFPQLDGLGCSSMAQWFASRSREEAKAYWQHPVLGSRLRECIGLMLYWLCPFFGQEQTKVITMEMLGKVKRLYSSDKKSLHEIAKTTGLSRNTIRKWVRGTDEVDKPSYRRKETANKLTAFHQALELALKADSHRTKQNRRQGPVCPDCHLHQHRRKNCSRKHLSSGLESRLLAP